MHINARTMNEEIIALATITIENRPIVLHVHKGEAGGFSVISVTLSLVYAGATAPSGCTGEVSLACEFAGLLG